MGPKKQKATSAETSAIKLGQSQIAVGQGLKNQLDPAINATANRDDGNLFANRAAYGVNSAIGTQLKTPMTAVQRALAVSTGRNSGAGAVTSASATNAENKISRLKTATELSMGSMSASNSSTLSTASAQANASEIAARASMEKQQRVMNNVAQFGSAYAEQKQTMDIYNANSINAATTTNKTATQANQMDMLGRVKMRDIGKG